MTDHHDDLAALCDQTLIDGLDPLLAVDAWAERVRAEMEANQ